MNELDKRDFPKADVPQESSAQAQNAQTFMTAMPECEPLLLSHFIAMCCVVSGCSKNGSDSSGGV